MFYCLHRNSKIQDIDSDYVNMAHSVRRIGYFWICQVNIFDSLVCKESTGQSATFPIIRIS